MSSRSSHEDVVELLPAAALGILEKAAIEVVLTHLQSCQRCARDFDSFQELVGVLSLSLPLERLDAMRAAHVRARLATRTRQRSALLLAARRIMLAERWSGWMVAAGLGALLLSHHAFHEPLESGWIAAAVLGVALVIIGLYTRLLRKRIAALTKRPDAADPDELS